jgi:hypothetical protein
MKRIDCAIGRNSSRVESPPRARGRCLCGAVRYEVRGPLRDVMLCHCEECRRWTGYLGAFTSTCTEHLSIADERALRWVDSPRSDRHARRGFCAACGSSLFWLPAGGERVNIAAGTLERPTGLRVAGHWYPQHAGDYDELPEDGLPRGSEVDLQALRWS